MLLGPFTPASWSWFLFLEALVQTLFISVVLVICFSDMISRKMKTVKMKKGTCVCLSLVTTSRGLRGCLQLGSEALGRSVTEIPTSHDSLREQGTQPARLECSGRQTWEWVTLKLCSQNVTVRSWYADDHGSQPSVILPPPPKTWQCLKMFLVVIIWVRPLPLVGRVGGGAV